MNERPTKHQRFFSWQEPGEWTEVPEQRLKYHSFGLGQGKGGEATRVIVVRYEPGAEVAPHYHQADYCSIVVEGSIEVTRKTHEVGSMRTATAGTAYGPLVAGPDGCTVVDVFAVGEPGSPARAVNVYL
jgi:quercetin dioxygenase-like cupin family protein